jgi:hypothetical protein
MLERSQPRAITGVDRPKKPKTLYFAPLDELQMLQLSYERSLRILPDYFINSKFSNRGLSPNLHLSWHWRKN